MLSDTFPSRSAVVPLMSCLFPFTCATNPPGSRIFVVQSAAAVSAWHSSHVNRYPLSVARCFQCPRLIRSEAPLMFAYVSGPRWHGVHVSVPVHCGMRYAFVPPPALAGFALLWHHTLLQRPADHVIDVFTLSVPAVAALSE